MENCGELWGPGGNGWEWVGMSGGNGWEWVGMGGNGWEYNTARQQSHWTYSVLSQCLVLCV